MISYLLVNLHYIIGSIIISIIVLHGLDVLPLLRLLLLDSEPQTYPPVLQHHAVLNVKLFLEFDQGSEF